MGQIGGNKLSDKKICLVIPSLIGGGMERVMSELANYLAEQGVNVSLILMFRDEMFYSLHPDIKVIQPSFKKVYNLTYAFFLFPFLRRRIRRLQPDTVLSFGERYNSYVLISTWGLKVPVYISDRSSPNKRLGPFNLWMSKVLYKKAAGIIAQTSKAAELLSERLSEEKLNIRVIHNPLRTVKRAKSRKKNQILALGRLVREKRYDRLLEIISRLKDKDWKLLIVGDGYQRSMVETLIDDYDLFDRVILAGEQKEVDRFLGESSIYALTSDIEGFPNALCEAMVHGLACISYDCVAGPSDIIQDGVNGFLIEEGDKERFARELDRLIEDPELRKKLGREAEKINARLHGDRIFEQYLDFILENHQASH